MDRRFSIKAILTFSIGALVLPSCLQSGKKASLLLKNFTINGDEEDLISAVCNAIIPTGDTPGAKDVGATEFALVMMDDCYSPEDQQKFVKGLKEFNEAAKESVKKSFSDADVDEQTEFLKFIETNQKNSESVSFFYNNIKWLTNRAFTQSEYYLTKVRVYNLIPGKFYGCVQLT